jgi:hypothetical protein
LYYVFQIDWPQVQLSSDNVVNIDAFWGEMENKSLEQSAFASVDLITSYEGMKIAPFIPPSQCSDTVVNTENLKTSSKINGVTGFQGNTSKLAGLVQRGVFLPLSQYSHSDLYSLCQRCDIPVSETDSKVRRSDWRNSC